jgi:hypothetical protein
MARPSTHVLKTTYPERVLLVGSFVPNAAVSPVAAGNALLDGYGYEDGYLFGSGIYSVIHTATGVFTITLDDKFHDFEGAFCSLQLASAANTACQFGAIDTDAKTIVIRTFTPGTNTAADIAYAAGNRVMFGILVAQTDLP